MSDNLRFSLVVEDRGSHVVKKFTMNSRLLSNELKSQRKGFAGWRKEVGSARKSAGGMSRSIATLIGVGAGAGIVGLGLSIVKTGAQFTQSMATVKGVMRATQSEFDALNAKAREMGATTEFTASQSADALKFLGMAGFEASEAIGALPGVLDLATAGGLELARSADIASNALTAMQLEVSELGRVNDVFVSTITRSNVNMEQMAEAFKFGAPKAAAYGVEVEELSAMIGILGNAGIQGSMAGTQLSFAFGKVDKVFQAMGMDGSGKTFIDALEEMNRRGATTNDIMTAFGERGGRAALVLRKLIPDYKRLALANRAAEGEAKKLADTMRDTLTGEFKTLKSTMESLALDIFNKYETNIRGFVVMLTEGLRNNKEALLDVVELLGVMVQAVATAAGWAFKFFSVIQKGLEITSKAFGLASTGAITWEDAIFNAGNAVFDWEKKNNMLNESLVKTNKIIEAKPDKIGKKQVVDIDALIAKGGTGPSIFGEIEADQAALDERKAMLAKWQEESETFRLDRFDRQIYYLDLERDEYAKFVEDKQSLDDWYNGRREQIDKARIDSLKKLDQKVKETESTFDKVGDKLGDKITDDLVGSLTNANFSIKELGMSYAKFAYDTVANLAKVIVKALFLKAISSSSPYGAAAVSAAGAIGTLFHEGGVVGQPAPQRAVPASTFIGAPRLHNGGVAGLKSDETAAILKNGETVSKEGAGPGELKIVNIVDKAMVRDEMSTAEGGKVILNQIRANAESVRRIIG